MCRGLRGVCLREDRRNRSPARESSTQKGQRVVFACAWSDPSSSTTSSRWRCCVCVRVERPSSARVSARSRLRACGAPPRFVECDDVSRRCRCAAGPAVCACEKFAGTAPSRGGAVRRKVMVYALRTRGATRHADARDGAVGVRSAHAWSDPCVLSFSSPRHGPPCARETHGESMEPKIIELCAEPREELGEDVGDERTRRVRSV